MGKFQPSIGGNARPPKRVVQKEKGATVSSAASQNTASPSNTFSQNESRRFVSKRAWIVLLGGLLVVNFFVFFVIGEGIDSAFRLTTNIFHLTEIRYWSWWYWPVFWGIVIGTGVRYLLVQRVAAAKEQGENRDYLRQLQRLLAIVVLGLMVILICTHSDIAEVLKPLVGRFREIEFSWWSLPFGFTVLIVVLGGVWWVQKYRENHEGESNIKVILWSAVGGMLGVALLVGGVLAYHNGYFSLSLPWWGWSVFFCLVIAGLLLIKTIQTFRESEASTPTVSKPTTQQSAATMAPKGFNTSFKGNSGKSRFRAGVPDERTPLFERLGLSSLREMGMIVWLIPVGLILMTAVGYFCYRLMTMERIDAEGYPVATPWWVWILPLLFLTLGAGIWKVVLLIRENAENGAFRSPKPRSVSQLKQQKPKGFNMQGQSGFRRGQQESAGLFSQPIFWCAIIGGVLLLIIFLVIVL